MKAIKSNMVDEIGLPQWARRVMLCTNCRAEFSANAGDYFGYPDDHVFTCPHCESDRMELLYKTKQIIYSEEPPQ